MIFRLQKDVEKKSKNRDVRDFLGRMLVIIFDIFDVFWCISLDNGINLLACIHFKCWYHIDEKYHTGRRLYGSLARKT